MAEGKARKRPSKIKDEIGLTEDELDKIFHLWYSEHGANPDEFEYDDNPKSATKQFLYYADRVKNELSEDDFPF